MTMGCASEMQPVSTGREETELVRSSPFREQFSDGLLRTVVSRREAEIHVFGPVDLIGPKTCAESCEQHQEKSHKMCVFRNKRWLSGWMLGADRTDFSGPRISTSTARVEDSWFWLLRPASDSLQILFQAV